MQTNLHSTVVLLKADSLSNYRNTVLDLHSTVVLLKAEHKVDTAIGFVEFTFYCSSIKGILRPPRGGLI